MIRFRVIVLTALSAGLPTLDALAQNALDANTQVGSQGRNAPSKTAPSEFDFRARNFIVTDSVAGGRGFRGNVGYQASGDFTGDLGSDDTFGFRSNSALSDLLFITSPQRLDAFNIAQGTGVFEFRRDFTSLPASATYYSAKLIDDAKVRLDRTSAALMAGSLLATAVAPEDVGYVRSADGGYTVISSALEGLGIRPDGMSFDGISIYDRASARQEMARSGNMKMDLGLVPFVSAFDRARFATLSDDLAARGEAPPAAVASRIERAGPSGEAYDAIVERILEQYADQENVQLDLLTRDSTMRTASSELGKLEGMISGSTQRQLRGMSPQDRVRNSDTRYEGVPRSPLDGFDAEPTKPTEPGDESATPTDPAPDTEPEAESAGLSIDEMARILRHRTQIGELSVTDRGRLARAVFQGEAALRDGRFFKAERRFEDAITINPGNPLLELARANAQLGAGLYLSAALTLNRTFTGSPEVIDARFKPELLPNRTRLDFAVVAIRERLDRGHDLPGYGISLAYIGHQTGQPELIGEGLAFVKGEPRWEVFGRLLRGIWLDDPTDPNAVVDPLPDTDPETSTENPSIELEDIPGPSILP